MPTWDDRIDEAAQELTEGQPGPGFRTRVLARLDQRPRRWSRGWLLAPAAAIAIAVFVVVMPRERVEDVKPESTGGGVKANATTAPVHPTPSSNEVRLKGEDPAPGMRAPVRRKPETTGTNIDVPFASELALAPIEVPALVIAAPSLEDLADVTPLAIEEITIQTIDFAQ